MLNKLLYAVFRTAPNVRLVKTAIATGVSACLGFIAQSLVEGGWEIPVIFTTVLPPLILAAEKWIQAWGASS